VQWEGVQVGGCCSYCCSHCGGSKASWPEVQEGLLALQYGWLDTTHRQWCYSRFHIAGFRGVVWWGLGSGCVRGVGVLGGELLLALWWSQANM